MTETPERGNEPVTGVIDTYISAPVPPAVPHNRPNRLYQVAAWVAIVAGTLFIVGAVFFTGFCMGRHGGGCHHHHGGGQSHQQRPPMGSWPGGPGMQFGPGGPGPGGPGAAPSSAVPRP